MRLLLGLAIGSLAAMSAFAPAQDGGALAPRTQAAGVRIVRLSEVRGSVELDRNNGRGYEVGFLNLPVVEGSRLRTHDAAWAEVEFEDNSTLRITPKTAVAFRTLARDASGQTRSAIDLLEGTLYVSRMKGDRSDLTVSAPGETMTLGPGSHVRLDVYPSGSELVVVQGTVRVLDASGAVTEVDRRHALKFGGNAAASLVLSRDEAPGLYDRWDAAAVKFHEARLSGGVSPYGYGTGDLQYYGNFQSVDGCGRVWRPYLASAAFDPAASGVWAWYAGSGYAFVSPYQWGWTTFNSGSWVSCGAQGWGWQPGAWVGLKNNGIVEPIHAPGHRPRPLNEPAAGKPTLVRAGDRVVPRSEVLFDASAKLVRDSAGLGVPRGSVENLKEISRAEELGRAVPAARMNGNSLADNPLFALVWAQQNGSPGPAASGFVAASGPRVGPGGAALPGRPVMPVSLVEAGGGRGGYSGGKSSSGGLSSGGSGSGGSGWGSGLSSNSGSGVGTASASAGVSSSRGGAQSTGFGSTTTAGASGGAAGSSGGASSGSSGHH